MNKSSKSGALRLLLFYIKSEKFVVTGIIIFAVFGNTLALYAPTILGRAINLLKPGGTDFSALSTQLFILAAVYTAASLSVWICSLLSVHLAAKVTSRLRRDAFAKLSALPLSTLDSSSRGDYITRFAGDADLIFDGTSQLLVQAFSAIVTVIAALFFMFRINALITLVVCGVTPLVFFVAKFVARHSTASFNKQQELLGSLGGFAEEKIRGLHELRAFSSENENIREFSEINNQLYTVGQRAQFFSSLVNPTSRFVNYISYIAVGLTGAALAVNQGLSVGAVAAFLTYSTLFSKPFNEISALSTQIMSASAALKRLFALISKQEEPRETDLAPSGRIRGNISFENVSFSYSKDKPLIDNFNLDIKSGSTVAIVGPTGAGKTTIVNLLMRFYEISEGRITLDGRDIREIRREELRRSFGMVLQDAWLFPGTIRENIAFGNPEASEEDIVRAAKDAHVHGFIRRLPEGYDTVLNQGAEKLSEGQKQLITIARAMLSNPPMLILDEATSSVDVLTEQRIQRSFLEIMRGKTSFVIAHRLSTIKNADIIIVMMDGAVIQQGTHDELVNREGFYKELTMGNG